MAKIITIGYAGLPINEFVKILKENKIDYVIDVRSSPFSKFHTEYNENTLMNNLKNEKIWYRSLKDEFGARQTDRRYFKDGVLDFIKFWDSENFKNGIAKMNVALDAGKNMAILCAEKDPKKCHRFLMVSEGMNRNGIHNIEHVIWESDKNLESIKKDIFHNFDMNTAELMNGVSDKIDKQFKVYMYKHTKLIEDTVKSITEQFSQMDIFNFELPKLDSEEIFRKLCKEVAFKENLEEE